LIHEGEGVGFAWSPDGKWICFAAYGSLQWISVTGDSLVQVTAGASDKRPAWSPDGGTIAFVRTGIWILGVTNGQATRLSGEGDYPSWHPNGREVVSLVACGSTDPYDLRTLYEMQAVDIRTGAWRRVWSVRSTATVEFATMSPAGDAVAFSAVPTGGIAQVWKVSLTDSTVVRLTDDGGDFPSWSPDGTMLVYTRNAADDGGIWMMRADGSGKRRLTSP
jgi:TolB protein